MELLVCIKNGDNRGGTALHELNEMAFCLKKTHSKMESVVNWGTEMGLVCSMDQVLDYFYLYKPSLKSS